MFWIEFAIVLACIFIGARLGGVALGTVAGLGLALFVFGFRQSPGQMPIDVLLIIIAVVSAASALQAAFEDRQNRRPPKSKNLGDGSVS